MKHLIATVSFCCLLLSAHAKSDVQSAVTLDHFNLAGNITNGEARFTLTATAHVQNPRGGSLEILAGPVALTDFGSDPKWSIRAEDNRFLINFERRGTFPIRLLFVAAVRHTENWHTVEFHLARSPIQPIEIQGIAEKTELMLTGASRPERNGDQFRSYLPPDGTVKLAWKDTPAEGEGKLFYAAEMLSQLTIGPGLARQTALLDYKVMQGELNQVALLVHGVGEITRVQGEQVLAWNFEPVAGSTDRRLIVRFNQAQKDRFGFQVQLQTALGAFPQSIEALRLRPEGASRFAGYWRIVNEGAVRLEVTQSAGLSQISPDQFPETEATRTALTPTGSQRFVYRFSGPDFALRVQAEQILPEIGASQLLVYRFSENELGIEAEIELEVREAPLRELLLRIPRDFAVARLNASGLADYFMKNIDGEGWTELRLVFGQPVSGRQLVELRLERNKPLGESVWAIPRVEVVKAKSVRGHIAIAADTGFRLTPERTEALTEIATAFFPRKVGGIQSAFRLSDAVWQATMRVERLPQTIQADALHLFSIGEGIAYGSSLINYTISGAPVGVFKVQLSDEYFNVEFAGKDIRNWQKTPSGYLVQLHTPISGAYTLLATYERPFKAQGETLTFTGAHPLDPQSERGHTLITSAYQFQVKASDVSAALVPLETGEVPPEYRLFFDAPVLAAYRYASRPFNLSLTLTPLLQGDSLSQVIDRASLTTRISKEGQVVTTARYYLKNRGHPHFKVSLPPGTELWSATINGAAVVPVTDAGANLIPLPPGSDPNAVITVDLKLAARSSNSDRIRLAAPLVAAPVMLAEWKLTPETGQRLVQRRGSMTPVSGGPDQSGFAQLARAFSGGDGSGWIELVMAVGLVGAALVAWIWASAPTVRRFSPRHIGGLLLGGVALGLAALAFGNLIGLMDRERIVLPAEITFLAPVQQPGSGLNVEVDNLSGRMSALEFVRLAWPGLLALPIWLYAWVTTRPLSRQLFFVIGWVLIAWAALRFPNGAIAFLLIVAGSVALQSVVPVFRRMFRVPPSTESRAASAPGGAASAATASLVLGLIWLSCAFPSRAAAEKSPAQPIGIADSVAQELRIEDNFVSGTAKIRWTAERGQILPLLSDPAVLTRIRYPVDALKLVQGRLSGTNSIPSQELVAKKSGMFEVEFQYGLPITRRQNESGFILPTHSGLVNQLDLTVLNLDVDVVSTRAVALERNTAGTNTHARLVLSPGGDNWIGWRPRTRDIKREAIVFYAEIAHLYVPAAGVIEGAHSVIIRPAQGELTELVFSVPAGASISDVADGPPAASASKPQTTSAPLVSTWRFDPDHRKLRVSLTRPQSRPFALLVRSQFATGPLPLDQSVELPGLENATGQIGLVGIATDNEVQLDDVRTDTLSPLNLEDFSNDLVASLHPQNAPLTLRRAFRYSGTTGKLSIKASAVEPDVRVETQVTLSLGEDRNVLAATALVDITRAGIFHLSFLLPAGFEVESISGAALSHWTELKHENGRIITLHLNGKTEGRQQFVITLTGAGIKSTKGWSAPQVSFRQASKQRGTLLIVPEQGFRLQVAASEGLTQLDPQKSGIKQKGVLGFRVLQTPSSLSLDIEQVDPWTQVTSLQQATLTEAQVNIDGNLQYQIENTGLKSFGVLIPTNAQSVRFQGEQIADFRPVSGSETNGLQAWEIKLHRRVIGTYLLQVHYQTALPLSASELVVRGLQALDVNLQRGFVTVHSVGRLQVRADSLPATLQTAEWQSIPRALQQGLPEVTANFSYRVVEAGFDLPLRVERHEATKLLEARVNNVELKSVIAEDGIMLTQVRIELLPGDKRLLSLLLPRQAQFWFAFVEQHGVWPWRDQDHILIPLEQQTRGNKTIVVEFFYSCHVSPPRRALDLELLAPKLDLPLENVIWRVALNDKWEIKRWSGSLQLEQQTLIPAVQTVDVQNYLQNEAAQQQDRTKKAEEFLALGNSALAQGEPQQARRAFQAAFGLSTHDAAFNEDARVQLHNIKLQQALVGLNVRQAGSAREAGPLEAKLRDWHARKELNYTQQDAKDIIDRNSAEDNAALMRLAERLVQQQDAVAIAPAALRATIPEQGRLLTFKRAIAVDPWAELRIELRASVEKPAPWGMKVLVLTATLALLVPFAWAARRTHQTPPA